MGPPHDEDANFRCVEYRLYYDSRWSRTIEERVHGEGGDFPEVAHEAIDAFYRDDMACMFPCGPKWAGKSMSRPHLGKAVPKRLVEKANAALRVSGGGTHTGMNHVTPPTPGGRST